MSNDHNELAATIKREYTRAISRKRPSDCWDAPADAILAAGYRKPRTITTPAEADLLADRSAFVTPGEIIFRKWQNYYGTGKHAWERELGQMVPSEFLSESGHFPATVLWEPAQ